MRLHGFVNEVMDIAYHNNTNMSVAESMFFYNCENGKNIYKGATLDYTKLMGAVSGMKASTWQFNTAFNKHAKEINALRAAGKRKEARELMLKA